MITKFDPERRRATVSIEDPENEDLGWTFDDVPFDHLLPLGDDEEAPVPKNPKAFALTLAGFREEDPAKALPRFMSALEFSPETWFAAEECGRIYQRAGNWETAAWFFRKAVATTGGASWAHLHFHLGSCLGKLKQRHEQVRAYERCLNIDPDFPYARNNLGWALIRSGEIEKAIPVLQEALRRGNDGKYPERNLAKALERVGRYGEAIALVERDRGRNGHLRTAAQTALERLRSKAEGGAGAIPKSSAISATVADEPDDEEDAHAAPSPRSSTTDQRDGGGAFFKERHLELELVRMIESGRAVFGRQLRLFRSDDGRPGQQFAIPGIGIIDILAVDADSGDLVVIELKKGSSGDEVIGQTLRYVGWVRERLLKPGQQAFGMICVHEVTEKVRLAASAAGVEVVTYGVKFA